MDQGTGGGGGFLKPAAPVRCAFYKDKNCQQAKTTTVLEGPDLCEECLKLHPYFLDKLAGKDGKLQEKVARRRREINNQAEREGKHPCMSVHKFWQGWPWYTALFREKEFQGEEHLLCCSEHVDRPDSLCRRCFDLLKQSENEYKKENEFDKEGGLKVPCVRKVAALSSSTSSTGAALHTILAQRDADCSGVMYGDARLCDSCLKACKEPSG
jgi:hypothetical protein